MKANQLIILMILLTLTGCSVSKSVSTKPIAVSTETTFLNGSRNESIVNRHLKPLERPQVRFEIERAIWHADSAWVVMRVAIPHRSILRKECFMAQITLQVPDGIMELGELTLDSGNFVPDNNKGVEINSRPKRISCLYLSWRFAWDDRMKTHADMTVFTRLTDGRHLFLYQPLTLPLFWCDDREENLFWPKSTGIPEEALLERSPFE